MEKRLMTWRGVVTHVAYERNKYWQLSAGGSRNHSSQLSPDGRERGKPSAV